MGNVKANVNPERRGRQKSGHRRGVATASEGENEERSYRCQKHTFPREEFPTVLPTKCDTLRNFTQKLHNLRDMIIVLAVPCTRGGVEEVVAAGDEFE